MKAYLFGSIFYEKDIEYNKELLLGIRRAFPGIDIFAPQEAPFNDKRSFGDSKAIFEGDYARLKEVDLLIGCLDGDVPPIGSVTEAGLFCEMAKNNPNKHIVVLHTDTRDAFKTASPEKFEDMANNQCASQFNYFNLFVKGVIESCGVIVGSKQQLFEYVHELYLDYKKNNHQTGIYLITNRVNGKKYIGQAVDIPRRLNSHRWAKTKNTQAVDAAIAKYGIENFTFEILEECNADLLNEREAYWAYEVFNYSTVAPNGYNVGIMGNEIGACGAPGKMVSSYNKNGELQYTYPSVIEAARQHKCNPHAIEQALDDNTRTSGGLLWATGNNKTITPHEKPLHGNEKASIAVDISDSFGNYITTCKSIIEASRYLGFSMSGVYSTIINPNFRIHGYYITPAGVKPTVKLRNRQLKVYAYDKTTRHFVKEYDSANEASHELGYKWACIRDAAKGECYYSAGYIWSFLRFDVIPANYLEINKEFWENNKN